MGGSITEKLGWRWVFWFLVILTGSHFLAMILFFPETQRNIVDKGNGRVRGVYWSFFSHLQRSEVKNNQTKTIKPKRHYPNPFACLPILAHKDSLVVILIYAITYSVKMTLQTSLSAQCVEIYHLDYLSAGLIYLPSGVAGAIGSFGTGMRPSITSFTDTLTYQSSGKYLDKTYRRKAKKLSRDRQEQFHHELPDFPIEKIRLQGIYLVITVSALGTAGYGIALMTKTVNLTSVFCKTLLNIVKHISVMLIMQFLTGMTTASTFTVSLLTI